MHPHMGAVRSHGLDALDVRFGHFFGFVVGMANLVSAELTFAANFACTCHRHGPPYMKITAEKQPYDTIRFSWLQGENTSLTPFLKS